MGEAHGHYCKEHLEDYVSVKKRQNEHNDPIFGIDWFLSFFLKKKDDKIFASQSCQKPIIKASSWQATNDDAGKR